LTSRGDVAKVVERKSFFSMSAVLLLEATVRLSDDRSVLGGVVCLVRRSGVWAGDKNRDRS